ncbi:MAG TPA: D-alanyl-D-alanine carboxypeptidase/D-alanyl-D-alanine-endopeptidase [Mycobacteriales bacterium]|nr:D-alanyl-D-alanine carboxypeptidase/D-alanyl-D-alanine-endopeptidase [Mycobacteriales bacterium]
MRWPIAVLATTVVLAAGGGASYVVLHDEHGRRASPTPSPTAAAPVPTPALSALRTEAPEPTRAGVTRRLHRLVRDPAFGGALAGLVLDAGTGDALFVRRPAAALPPASTTKLLTAVAALETLGPDAHLTTSVVRSGRTLYLVGGGDVTLAAGRRQVYPAPATLTALAARTASAVAGTTFRLRYDDTAWRGPRLAEGWTPGYVSGGNVAPVTALEVDEARLTGFTSLHPQPRAEDPAAAAAAAFDKALAAAGVRVSGRVRTGRAPRLAPLATVASPSVAALVQRMLTDSDNDLAEALARAVARKEGEPPTFAGAARAIGAVLARLGLPTGNLRLVDGSGLSHLDRVSARLLAGVLRLVVGTPQLRPVTEGLPVAGFTGTLADRYGNRVTRAGAGVVRAKTGTLAGVNTLAGTVVDADGRLLVFAFLTDRAMDPDTTEHALDRLAASLARCGCG